MKKILAVFLLLCVIVSNFPVCVKAAEEEEEMDLEKYSVSLNLLTNDDFYAGRFLDENGRLVLMYTEIPSDKIIDDAIYQKADYSYKYLEKVNKEITERYLEAYADDLFSSKHEKEILDSVTGFGIFDKNNKIIIDVDKLDERKILVIKKYLGDYDCVSFRDKEPMKNTSATWNAGRKIKDGSGNFSTGFRAYWIDLSGSRHNGFVTAGHATSVGSYIYNNSGTLIGQCLKNQNGGNTDAAFVEITNSNYSMSNQVYYSDSLGNTGGVSLDVSNVVTTFTVGQTIYKAGYSTYLTSGEIYSTNYTGTFEGTVCSDLISTAAYSDFGDSGGVSYVYSGGSYKIAGILKAKTTLDKLFVESYICKASHIKQDLGVVQY